MRGKLPFDRKGRGARPLPRCSPIYLEMDIYTLELPGQSDEVLFAPVSLLVERIYLPAHSTVGFAWGIDQASGQELSVVLDAGVIKTLDERINHTGKPVETEVEHWQVWGSFD